jgi:hypothetical protein
MVSVLSSRPFRCEQVRSSALRLASHVRHKSCVLTYFACVEVAEIVSCRMISKQTI